MNNILVAGGDMRFVYLANLLNEYNFNVTVSGFDDNTLFDSGIETVKTGCISDMKGKSEVIILPLPVSRDNITLNTPLSSESILISDVLSWADDSAIICGGVIDDSLKTKVHHNIIDYAARDDFAYYNAVPTAEGAIELLMHKSDKTLSDMKCAVLGFGRCAEILAFRLKAMCVSVTVFARSSKDLSHASALGLNTIHLSEITSHISGFDGIFNTIPFPLFKSDLLNRLKDSCIFIDIASAPGCIADESCKRNINYTLFGGIPGRYSPYSASEILRTVILTIMRESGKDAYQCL